MKRASLGLAASLLLAPLGAAAAVCEASYQAEGRKATRWFNLGEVAGKQMDRNCVAKARNHLGGLKPADLGLGRIDCDDLPIKVKVFTRLDAKSQPMRPEVELESSFNLDCRSAKSPPKRDD